MLTTRLLSCILLCVLMLAACGKAAETPEPTVPVETAAPEAPAVIEEDTAPAVTEEEAAPTATRLPASNLLIVPDKPAPPDTPEPTATLEPTVEPTATVNPTDTPEPTEEAPDAAASNAGAPAVATRIPSVVPISTSALIIREDETVAPPLAVIVSANREMPGYNFIITGLVRNDGSENYAGFGIVATYFRADGSRHGPIKVNVECPILAPGEMCPFTVNANAKGLTEVMLHPEGHPTNRTTAQVNISSVSRSVDGIGYVHITGNVTNPNPASVYDVAINGVLLDQGGEIVSIGTDILVGELQAGATNRFDVPLRYAPYAQYQLFVQAEPR